MGDVFLQDEVPSFSRFQLSVPRVLLETLLQLQEPDSMISDVCTPNGVPVKLTVTRTPEDNLQIQADGGQNTVLEGVSDQWCFSVKEVIGPIYLVTGAGNEEPNVSRDVKEEAEESVNVGEYEEGHIEMAEGEPQLQEQTIEDVTEQSEQVIVETVQAEIEVDKAYPEIINTLESTQQGGLHVSVDERDDDDDYEEDHSPCYNNAKPLRTDVDLLLAAIEASNAAEQASLAATPNSVSTKRGPGRPKKAVIEMPDGEPRGDVLAVMNDIPLVTKDVTTFKCYLCAKAFTSMDTLKRHLKIRHGERAQADQITTSLLAKAYICFVCQRPTAGLRSLQKHLLGVHKLKYSKEKTPAKPRYIAKNTRRDPRDPEVPSVQCELCGKLVVSYDNLRNHTKKVHGDHPELEAVLKRILDTRLKHHKRRSVVTVVCPLCNDKFAGLPVLKHIRMVHGPTMGKDDLESLLVQVKKEIQKSYNMLKKEKTKRTKVLTCTQCSQRVPYADGDAHMEVCKGDLSGEISDGDKANRQNDDMVVQLSGPVSDISSTDIAVLTTPDGSFVVNKPVSLEEGQISNPDHVKETPIVVSSQLNAPPVDIPVGKQTKMFSLLKQEMVFISPKFTLTKDLEATVDHYVTPISDVAECVTPSSITGHQSDRPASVEQSRVVSLNKDGHSVAIGRMVSGRTVQAKLKTPTYSKIMSRKDPQSGDIQSSAHLRMVSSTPISSKTEDTVDNYALRNKEETTVRRLAINKRKDEGELKSEDIPKMLNTNKPLFSVQSQKCLACRKVFASADALAHHIITSHKGEIVTPAQSSSTAQELVEEMTDAPNKVEVDSDGQDPKCRVCDKKFSDRATLLSHVRVIHGKGLQYHCEKCGQGWNNPVLYQYHKCPGLLDRDVIIGIKKVDKEIIAPIVVQSGSEPGELDYRQQSKAVSPPSVTLEDSPTLSKRSVRKRPLAPNEVEEHSDVFGVAPVETKHRKIEKEETPRSSRSKDGAEPEASRRKSVRVRKTKETVDV